MLVTPAHQCPTGVVLGPRGARRWSSGRDGVDGVIIEDDYDAEFRYDRQPVGSLQGLAPDRVIALGSVSKTLAPALRIGWMAVPRPTGPRRGAGSRSSSTAARPRLDQLALAGLIESGRYDRHLRRVRGLYRARRDALVARRGRALARRDPHRSGRRPPRAAPAADRGRRAAGRRPGGRRRGRRTRSGRLPGRAGRRHTPWDWPPALVIGFGNTTPEPDQGRDRPPRRGGGSRLRLSLLDLRLRRRPRSAPSGWPR